MAGGRTFAGTTPLFASRAGRTVGGMASLPLDVVVPPSPEVKEMSFDGYGYAAPQDGDPAGDVLVTVRYCGG